MKYRDNFLPFEQAKRCPCGKIGFDKKSAQTKRNFLMKRGNEKYLRIYQCPLSNTFHLTRVRHYEEEFV